MTKQSNNDKAVEMSADKGLSRRGFLGVAAGVSAAVATPVLARRSFGPSHTEIDEQPTKTFLPAASLGPASDGDLIVVTVQLEGGNDMLNTLVPLENGRYRDLRGSGAVRAENTVRIDSEYGLFAMPYLASMWDQGDLGIVHGVGYTGSSLSHFEDTDVWERGSVDAAIKTGWLGRALDAVSGGQGDPLLGMTIGNLSPSMRAPGWTPVTLPAYGTVPWTALDLREWEPAAKAFDVMIQPDRTDSSLAAAARSGQSLVFDLAELVGPALADNEELSEQEMQELEDGEFAEATGNERFFPGEEGVTAGELGRQMNLVADLVNAGLPTRAYHLFQGGYDTHANQAEIHPRLIRSLDLAIEQFHARLGANADRVVVITWTEFGRRPEWNGSGTDHGTAGLEFVVGRRAIGGHHGEAPSLSSFDENDNFRVTTDFRSYLAGVSEGVLGVGAADVFDYSVKALEVVK